LITITSVIDNAAAQSSFMWGEHGLSFLISTPDGLVLMDTGRSGTVLMHNLETLRVPLESLTALVLSHSHQDHTGGLPKLLAAVRGLPLYASPAVLSPRFVEHDGVYRASGLPIDSETLRGLVKLRLSAVPVPVLADVWTTGEITPRLEPDGRSKGQVVPEGSGYAPDPYRDDISLVVKTSAGLVLVCGCCHAGLLNTLASLRRDFGKAPIAIFGGTHVRDADAAMYDHIIDVLRREYGSPRLYLNHCTGGRAFLALTNAFGERVQPCPAGTAVSFD
jgi:7,8-dihydropterin-6-yl-methyl-4-(beta-D-ribofuranosyl)aminobenzene 5'-phosphate synthase